MDCCHTVQRGRPNEKGDWCVECGVKVFDVDSRECKDCAHFKTVLAGSICKKYLMGVTPNMNVTFRITEGSCWTAKGE